jgi:hypothetical protein
MGMMELNQIICFERGPGKNVRCYPVTLKMLSSIYKIIYLIMKSIRTRPLVSFEKKTEVC